MAEIASSATAVLIAHVAAHTKRIRLGSGGIMLPNHSPLVIAEQFGTLETLHPGRIDLGLGRAPGTDQVTLPSFMPVWRSCDFQEREVFDLYGIIFEGHPDLRRILMWPEFKDHPMRKDYVEPDDYEWEPTPHGEVHAKAKVHYPAQPVVAATTPAANAQ